jgi:DNA-binding NarL/FixJ family response regulator
LVKEATARSGGKRKSADMRTTYILIADRIPIVRDGIRHIIDDHPKFEVIAEAGNGYEAVDMAVESRPDVAVLGYALPLLNGIAATAEIRRRSRNTEVLIYTMHANEAAICDALTAGARGYVLTVSRTVAIRCSQPSRRLACTALTLRRPSLPCCSDQYRRGSI